MKKAQIFLIICAIVVIPLSVFSYCLIRTRSFPENKIILVINSSPSSTSVSIDKRSLDELKTVISENSLLNDQAKIIDIFEKERSKYIELLTIVSIILTIFSLFSFASGFIEKAESKTIKNDLESIKEKYMKEISDLKWRNGISIIENLSDRMRTNTNLVFDDNSIVDTKEKLEKFVSTTFSRFLRDTDITKLTNDFSIQLYSVAVYNFIGSLLQYNSSRFGESFDNWDIEKKPLLKIIVQQMSNSLGKELFEKIKTNLISLSSNNIIWGSY